MVGVPATVEHAAASSGEASNAARYVAETVQVTISAHFPFALDSFVYVELYHHHGFIEVEYDGRRSNSSFTV